jgi:hypothetical protein
MEVTRHVPTVLPLGKKTPISIVQAAGWAPEPHFTLQRREIIPAPARNRTQTVQSIARHYTEKGIPYRLRSNALEWIWKEEVMA